jgi:hypothetical protein
MGPTTQLRGNTAEIATLLGVIDTRLALIESATSRLDKCLNGNGQPGLIEDHRVLQGLVADHLKRSLEEGDARALLAKETKDAKDLLAEEARAAREALATEVKAQREKISGRTWAVVLAVIGTFITQAAGLAVLYIRMGGIK